MSHSLFLLLFLTQRPPPALSSAFQDVALSVVGRDPSSSSSSSSEVTAGADSVVLISDPALTDDALLSKLASVATAAGTLVGFRYRGDSSLTPNDGGGGDLPCPCLHVMLHGMKEDDGEKEDTFGGHDARWLMEDTEANAARATRSGFNSFVYLATVDGGSDGGGSAVISEVYRVSPELPAVRKEVEEWIEGGRSRRLLGNSSLSVWERRSDLQGIRLSAAVVDYKPFVFLRGQGGDESEGIVKLMEFFLSFFAAGEGPRYSCCCYSQSILLA